MKTSLGATLSTTDFMWLGLGLSTTLDGERLANRHFLHRYDVFPLHYFSTLFFIAHFYIQTVE